MEEEITEKVKLRKKGVVREYAEALLIAALVAFTIRAFVFEAFKIPSGSMIPTLSVGDHIFVNKFAYGLRIPFTTYHFWVREMPRRGEVVVFIYPLDRGKDFIKRVVGIPGDRIHIEGTLLTVNDETLTHIPLKARSDPSDRRRLLLSNGSVYAIPYVAGWENFQFFEEIIDGHSHVVQYDTFAVHEPLDVVVPEGHFFMVGDNRDNSADSREWGFVPFENIKGRAMFVWLSLDRDQGGIRWNEFGRWVD